MFDQTNTLAGGDTIAMPSVAADETAVMTLTLSNSAVTETYRDGNDLILVLAGWQEVRVEGFYYTADGSQLLIQDAETGAVVRVAVTEDGALIVLEPRSLAQLEQMFGTDAAAQIAGEAPVDLTADMSTQGAVAAGGGAIAVSGTMGTTTLMIGTAVVAANNDDGVEVAVDAVFDDGDPSDVTVEELTDAGVEDIRTSEQAVQVGDVLSDLGSDFIDSDEKVQALVTSIVYAVPADADPENIETTENPDGTVQIAIHSDDDGVADRINTVILDDDGTLDTVIMREPDTSGFGTRVHTFDSNGDRVRSDNDTDDDGDTDQIVLRTFDADGLQKSALADKDVDGLYESLIFTSNRGGSQTFTQAEIESLFTYLEDTSLKLLSAADQQNASLIISDKALTLAHNANGGTAITIDGDVGDVVNVNGGIVRDVDADTGVREAYTGTTGTLLFDPEIYVTVA